MVITKKARLVNAFSFAVANRNEFALAASDERMGVIATGFMVASLLVVVWHKL